MSGSGDSDIEGLIEAAKLSSAADPEQEIVALQDLLRVAWGLMSERQQAELIESEEAQVLLTEEGDEEAEE